MNAVFPLLEALLPVLIGMAIGLAVFGVMAFLVLRTLFRLVMRSASGTTPLVVRGAVRGATLVRKQRTRKVSATKPTARKPRTRKAVTRPVAQSDVDAFAADGSMPDRTGSAIVVPRGTPQGHVGPLVVRGPLDDQPADVIAALVEQVFGKGNQAP